MSNDFDPYYEWLGIPPKDQPPNHYRLLGIELYESNRNVIERASDRQMGHVRTFQSGRYSRQSQEMLNRLAAAKLCLLSPDKKAEYDERLRADLREISDSVISEMIPTPLAGAAVPVSAPAAALPLVAVPRMSVAEATRHRPKKSKRMLLISGAAAGTVVLLAGAILFLSQPPLPTPAEAGKLGPGLSSSALAPSDSPLDLTPRPASHSEGPNQAAPPMAVDPPVDLPDLTEGKPTPDPAGQTEMEEPSVMTPVAVYNEVDNPPTDAAASSWPTPSVELRQQIEAAKGMLHEQFAYCQAMPHADFITVAQQLRVAGYRPVRVSPYVMNRSRNLAVVWTRDGRPWRMVSGVTREQLSAAHAKLQSDNYWPLDVDGWEEKGDKYIALWSRGETALPSQIVLGATRDESRRAGDDMKAKGFLPRASHRLVMTTGDEYYGAVYVQPPQAPSWTAFEGTTDEYLSQTSRGLPIDVAFVRSGDGVGMTAIVLADDSRRSMKLHSGTMDEQLQQGIEFAGQGFQPLVVSVLSIPGRDELHTAAIWVERSVGVMPELKPGATASVAGATLPGAGGAPAKLAVPAGEQVDAALTELKDKLKSRVAAANTPWRQVNLASSLRGDARGETDPVMRYALLVRAREAAIEAGDAWGVVWVLDDLAAAFEADVWGLRVEAMDRVGPRARTDVQKRQLGEAAMTLVNEAAAAGQFDAADKLVASARRSRDLVRVAAARARALGQQREMAQAATAAQEKLKQSANDAAANQALGLFMCFVQNDWAKGLAHLARGADSELAKVAQLELASPADGKARLELAQQWHTWANRNGDLENSGAWQRAQYWFGMALAGLAGVERATALEQMQSSKSRAGPAADSYFRWQGAHQPPGEIQQLAGHSGTVTSLAASRSGRWVVSGSNDDTIRVWDLSTGVEVSRWTSGVGDVHGLALLADEQSLVIAGQNPKVLMANLSNRSEIGGFDIMGSVYELAISSDGRRLLMSNPSQAGNVLLADVTGSGQVPLPIKSSIRALDLSASGTLAALADENNLVHLVDLRRLSDSGSLTGYASYISDVAISPAEDMVVGGYQEGIVLWSLPSRQEISRIPLPGRVDRLGFAPDSRRLVVGCGTGQIIVIDAQLGTIVGQLTFKDPGAASGFTALTVLADGRGAVSSGNDGVLRVWRLPD